MMSSEMKPKPEMDAVNSALFTGLKNGKLLVQQCNDCKHLQFYPRPICVKCGSINLGWKESSGRGKIYSFTLIKRVIMNSKEFESELPYLIASVELEDGVRIYGRLKEHNARIGQQVFLDPLDAGDIGLPGFKLS